MHIFIGNRAGSCPDFRYIYPSSLRVEVELALAVLGFKIRPELTILAADRIAACWFW